MNTKTINDKIAYLEKELKCVKNKLACVQSQLPTTTTTTAAPTTTTTTQA